MPYARNIDMIVDRADNRSGSYAIPIGHTISFALPPRLYPIFAPSLSPFFAYPSIPFSPSFSLLLPLPTENKFGTRRSVLHAVPCHTREQTRKSNFHRRTYYQLSREYDVPRETPGSGTVIVEATIERADSGRGNTPLYQLDKGTLVSAPPFYSSNSRNETFYCTLKYDTVFCPLPLRGQNLERVLQFERGTTVPRIGPTSRINHACNFQLFSLLNEMLERILPTFLQNKSVAPSTNLQLFPGFNHSKDSPF